MKKKKGFTLVELLVVIAILAVLATVSVVGYMGFTKKAQISNDESLVTQLNTALKADEVVDGKPETPTKMLSVMEDNGFKVENLTPTTSKYNIVWNQEDNQFVLLDESDMAVYGTLSEKAYMNWRFIDSYVSTNGFSCYVKGNAKIDTLEITTGLDVGNNTINSITYSGTNSVSNVVVRTNNFDTILNVTAYENGAYGTSGYESDTINHYGYAKEIVLNKAGFSSYHEFGKVGFVTLNEGKLVVEKDSNIVTTYIPDSSKSYDIVMNDEDSLKEVYAKKAYDAETANEKINDSKVEVKPLTTDDSATEDTITSIVDDKKNNSKNEALDSEVNNGGIKVEGSYRVGDKGYTSFDEALTAAKSTKSTLALQTQMLYENEGALVNEGETLTIDLNGYTWKPSTKWYTIQNKGTLTIKDSGSNKEGKVISYTSGETGSSLIDNWGTLIIESGNFYSTCSTVIKNEPNAMLTINNGSFELNRKQERNSFYNAILNYGNAVINNGNFTSNAGSALWNGSSNENYNGIVTINGGTFVSTYNIWFNVSVGAVHDSMGTMTINNGIFIGDDTAIYYNSNLSKLYIYDGVFSYTSTIGDPYTFFNSGYDNAEIYGGTFKGKWCFVKDVVVKLYGGTFEQNPEERGIVIPDGYKVVDNGNGTWSVIKA